MSSAGVIDPARHDTIKHCVRYVFRPVIPPFRRVLLVESGSRHLIEKVLPWLYNYNPAEQERVDVLTCYPGLPEGFRPEMGAIYRVADHAGGSGRRALYRELRAQGYDACGIICSGEPIMTKWKWLTAWKLPAKIFIVNENGDFFFLDRANWRTVRHFVLYRSGLSGSGSIATLGRLLAFPFTLSYLLLFAAYVHIRRKVRA